MNVTVLELTVLCELFLAALLGYRSACDLSSRSAQRLLMAKEQQRGTVLRDKQRSN